ncbi:MULTISPECIES: excalibur calcium-binding domain-containing protein [unclassified Nostoc]
MQRKSNEHRRGKFDRDRDGIACER